MKIGEICDEISVRGGPFPGLYRKRPGSLNDRTLFCWFSVNLTTGYPHVSIHHEREDQDLVYFHITFPVLRLINEPGAGNWRDRSQAAERIEEQRYHIHLRIDERDKCVITQTDDVWRWKRVPKEQQNVQLSFDEMNKKAQQFADWFYAAALTTFPENLERSY